MDATPQRAVTQEEIEALFGAEAAEPEDWQIDIGADGTAIATPINAQTTVIVHEGAAQMVKANWLKVATLQTMKTADGTLVHPPQDRAPQHVRAIKVATGDVFVYVMGRAVIIAKNELQL